MPFFFVQLILGPVEVEKDLSSRLVRDEIEMGKAPMLIAKLFSGRDVFAWQRSLLFSFHRIGDRHGLLPGLARIHFHADVLRKTPLGFCFRTLD